jgi:hypothetical protein
MENEVVPTSNKSTVEAGLRKKNYNTKVPCSCAPTLNDKSTTENKIVRIQDGKRKKEEGQTRILPNSTID